MLADAGSTGLEVILTLSIVVPLIVLAIVIWLFFKSARRFDAEQRATGAAPPDRRRRKRLTLAPQSGSDRS
jgi:flagellar basal body-associated protein FliL